MKPTCVAAVCLFTVFLCVAGLHVDAQSSDLSKSFVINPDRAFVYVKFDHIGKGAPFYGDEPSTRIWLRIVNNCRVAIVVSTFGAPDGALKGEAGVLHEVVADREPEIITVVDPSPHKPQTAKTQDTASKSNEKEGLMPRGYWADLSSAGTIAPGQELLFSIPVNHLGKRWHINIPFQFGLSSGKGPRADNIGGQPSMVIAYSLYDLPEKIQPAVEHWRDQ
jgi:hypothetical protein